MRSSGQGYRQGIPVRCRLAYVGQIAAYLRLSCLSTPLHCPLAPGLPGCTSPTEVFTSWCVCLRLTICLECPAGVPATAWTSAIRASISTCACSCPLPRMLLCGSHLGVRKQEGRRGLVGQEIRQRQGMPSLVAIWGAKS